MKVSEVSPGNSVPFGSRLTSLDGLRGLAVLSVVLFHTLRLQNAGVFGEIWKRFHGSAWAGVDLFFVLSGFLITGILLDSRGQENYFRNFYARRTLRIFPLYYTVLAVALLVVPFVVGFPRLPAAYPRLLENQLWLWTYTQNYLQATTAHTLPGFGHFWSLAVEEQFYWFWPLVVCLLPRKALLRFCLIVCAILPFIRLALILSGRGVDCSSCGDGY
jgi:peptidoglycan/LPS O-acetylase OafA/YrhL